MLLSIPSFSQNQALISRADSLNEKGKDLYKKGRFQDAIITFEESSDIRKEQLGYHSLEHANSINNIAICYLALNDFLNAANAFKKSLGIKEQIYGKGSPECLSNLNDLGFCYGEIGRFADALEAYQKALLICERLYGNKHPDYAAILHYIGLCYFNLGMYPNALPRLRDALSIGEKTQTVSTQDQVASLKYIGLCYHYLGQSFDAVDWFSRALSVLSYNYGSRNSPYVELLTYLSLCYLNLGNYSKALDYNQMALSIGGDVIGRDSPDYASLLNTMGNCYYHIGDCVKALEYYQTALPVIKKSYGLEDPYYAGLLGNIGVCYGGLHDYKSELDYLLQALPIFENSLGKEHPDYASCLYNIGTCYARLGRFLDSNDFLRQSLMIRETLLGKEHPLYAANLMNLGIGYYSLGDDSNAYDCFKKYSEITTSFVCHSFSLLTESQRDLFWSQYSGFFSNSVYDAASHSSIKMIPLAYDCALFGKGLLLNAETEMRKLILESGDGDALRMYNEIQESRVKLDRFYANPVGKKEMIDSLNNDIERRQQELMKQSKVFGDYTHNLALKWTDVQASLGKKDIAIEFETYTHQDTTFYIALTLRPEYTEPHLVELFNSKDLGQISPKRYYTSTSVTELVWGKFAEELNGVQNVYFSPAGELNNIAIEYLLDEDGKHLISEKRNYYRLTSTRELAKEHSSKKMTDATVYGGIRYDISPNSNLTGEETETERLARTATRSWMPMDSLSVTRGGWVYLPGTKEEAEAISSTLSSRRVRNVLLEGENGTEESFKALSGAKKDVIHIATHGFYWTETETARSGMETSSFMLDGESQAPKEDKALTRSGLLFAGAQNAFEGKDIPIDIEDGILTAKDISRMDLRGTDLVVISACQSGLGEVTGDGVFGLQRGFKKAGVQSIVMSLWEVSDEATKIMMTRFYEYLAKGKSKYDAFREAQRYLRKYEGGLYDEPEYYAAFVLLDAIK